MRKTKIMCTVGPKSFKSNIIKKMDISGVDEFRVNISHTSLSEYSDTIKMLQKWTKKLIYTDIEGAQLRTGPLPSVIKLEDNTIVSFSFQTSPKKNIIPLYPILSTNIFQVGDILYIDFNSASVQVVQIKSDHIITRVISGGKVGSNKGIGIDRIIDLPYLTEKDKAIIKIAIDMKQRHYCFSFASSGEDIKKFRSLFPYEIVVVSKIENRLGLLSLDEICGESDEILIDRGDLSKDIDLPAIAIVQKDIIKRAVKNETPVNVATNLLETMISSKSPTRAEISDITNTLIDGATGLVLAAETAIGNNPINSTRMVKRVIDQVELYDWDGMVNDSRSISVGLIQAHGGELIRQFVDASNAFYDGLPVVCIEDDAITDCFQIGEGAYSPLTGFMNMDEIFCVLNFNKLLNGNSWPLPIFLQISEENVEHIGKSPKVILADSSGKTVIALMVDIHIEKFVNKREIVQKWFMTEDTKHPGVKRLIQSGDYIISGKVLIINKPSAYIRSHELTPYQSRKIFFDNLWETIVAFHTRNIPHRGHEFIQKIALSITNADALYISPVVGNKGRSDFASEIVIAAYNQLIKLGVYNSVPVIIGGFNTYSRFCGPREAVFTAICRQNFGCTHFIVGRDHAGINKYYEDISVRDYFQEFEDLLISILHFDEVVYSKVDNSYFEINTNSNDEKGIERISGTSIRKLLKNMEQVPSFLVRPEVIETVLGSY